MANWDYVLKFIICGDAAVGKSSLLVRLTDQRFLANPDPTLGVEFGSKLIYIPEEDKTVKLQCWDTAGTESFRSITRSYYRGAAGCLLVYDVTSRKSFENTRSWLADVREHADPNLTCILVGNKVDLCESATMDNAASDGSASGNGSTTSGGVGGESGNRMTSGGNGSGRQREVKTEEGEAFAKENDLLFVEASAKSGENVEHAFFTASKDILDKVKRGVFDQGKSPGVKQTKANNNSSLTLDQPTVKQGCCG
ncbi:ras-domain-containing [Pyrrhoderma noxium]|uniref:Ras-domain-containing n=1 Tax=Pyrrhoderma noxium TaxID=2282107 RepID=A0A286UVH2_9AGAM|nr:ras-domain-containing [Pyrrhoderma noxium]